MQEQRQTRSDAGEAVERTPELEVVSDVRPRLERVEGEDESGHCLKGYVRCLWCRAPVVKGRLPEHWQGCEPTPREFRGGRRTPLKSEVSDL
jgi:hypothetical protein